MQELADSIKTKIFSDIEFEWTFNEKITFFLWKTSPMEMGQWDEMITSASLQC